MRRWTAANAPRSATTTPPRPASKSRHKVMCPGSAPNPLRSFVSTFHSTAQTTDWCRRSVQTITTTMRCPTYLQGRAVGSS
ncbi:hypothetical protein PO909_001854 [Leuciscus waleckii]